jgi:hypothetical protein
MEFEMTGAVAYWKVEKLSDINYRGVKIPTFRVFHCHVYDKHEGKLPYTVVAQHLTIPEIYDKLGKHAGSIVATLADGLTMVGQTTEYKRPIIMKWD